MKTVLRSLMVAGMTAAFAAAPAAAQQKAWGFGFHGAYFQSGSLAKSSATDTELELDHRAAYGGGLEWWFGSRRVGFRTEATATKANFVLETDAGDNTTADAALLTPINGVNTILANASLMFRFLQPAVDRKFAPFISIGGGMVRWDHDNDGVQPQDVRVPSADVQIFGNAQTEAALFGSLGTDIFFTPSIALRLEAKDYWNPRSPYIELSEIAATSGDRHQVGGQNLLWTGGLQFFFGGERVSEPGFISVAPEPEPAPVVVQAPPPPPPAPTTESVNMCYVDQSGRLQTVSATRNLSNNNIYVTRNGSEVAFTTAYPTSEPYYIKGSSWYVSSRPLIVSLEKNDTGADVDYTVNMPANRIEFVNFGSSQPMAASDLYYVGSVKGTPVYARTSDIGAFQSDLDARMRTTTDLNRMLEDQAFADRYVNEIQTFYMPVEPGTDCVFQPVSSTHVVRRTRG